MQVNCDCFTIEIFGNRKYISPSTLFGDISERRRGFMAMNFSFEIISCSTGRVFDCEVRENREKTFESPIARVVEN
jgi:hypothetical protein